MKKNPTATALLLTIVCVLGAACSKSAPEPSPGARNPAAGGPSPGMPVEAENIVPAALASEITAIGSLRSDESVTLSAEIAGRIAAIRFQEGQRVKAGQVLFDLDDSVQRAELAQARAGQILAQRNFDRASEMFSKNLISKADHDTVAANLDAAQASLALAEARIAKMRIRAPFASTAGLRTVSPGDYITPGQALVNLEAMQSMKLDVRLAEAALPALSAGQKLRIEVDSYPGQTFSGEIYAIDPRVADATRSIGVRARIRNPEGKLRPGLFARVKLELSHRPDALLVPEQAIFPRGDQQFVYVIDDGKAALRPVTIGLRQGGKVEITSGLKAGETVITAGLQKIGPGAPVMAVNMAPPPASATPPKPQ